MPGGLKMMKLAVFDNGTYAPNLAISIKEHDDKPVRWDNSFRVDSR